MERYNSISGDSATELKNNLFIASDVFERLPDCLELYIVALHQLRRRQTVSHDLGA